MEVHHHSHTSRKKWTHYFWEFLMLFLAVFAGFLAENQREHYVEHQRERAYMKTLVEDIELDIGELNTCITFRVKQGRRIDSLLYFLAQHKDSLNDIYFLARWSTRTSDLFYNDRTIQQLKNSGGLRLIKSAEVSEKIILYDAHIRRIIGYRQPLEDEIRGELRRIYSKVMDGVVFNSMLSEDPNIFAIRPRNNPRLFSSDPGLINEMVMNAQYLKSIYAVTKDIDERLIEFGRDLIALIKEEYHLK